MTDRHGRHGWHMALMAAAAVAALWLGAGVGGALLVAFLACAAMMAVFAWIAFSAGRAASRATNQHDRRLTSPDWARKEVSEGGAP